jgi:nitrogenase molybdenum-cofactor synthesis protein NifE
VSREKNIDVIPVHSEGFKGTKKNGYQAACRALANLIGTGDTSGISKASLNILGDFNVAGEMWQVRRYFERLGVQVISTITGDGRVDDIRKAHGAKLNVVQCSGSMMTLAQLMQEKYNIPYIRVSYFGIEDMTKALYDVVAKLGDRAMMDMAQNLIQEEVAAIMPEIRCLRSKLEGAKALIYTGGAFKVFSLVRSLRTLGMKTVVAGSQTGDKEDYQQLRDLCDDGTVLLDDTNPLELAKYIQEKDVDLVIGGVKERPIAYKLGVGFCDHNHERKICLAGYSGMLNFAREVHTSVCSPVWALTPRRRTFPGGR